MPVIKVKVLKGWKQEMMGLVGAGKAYPVLLNTRWGIHTFGMKFPIDVLILDNRYKIVKTAENLRPNKIFFWPVKYDKVLELPEGEIKKLKLKTGNRVSVTAFP